MSVRFRFTDLRTVVLLIALSFSFVAMFPGSISPASAQGVSVEFRTALDPYGSWRNHGRWGDVWIPSDRGRDWRPYTVGRWSYTDDYGWYWRAADREAAWGSIVYHYGRWVLDEELGWVWIPGNVWAPAWVSWRRGEPRRGDHRHVVGWAPLPPDEIIVTISDEPRYWAFVPARQLVAAELIASVVLPPEPLFIRETVIVHRTVVVRKGGATFAVSAGISPDYVALDYGRPIPSYSVRPLALAGTMAPPNAVTIRAEQYRDFRDKGRAGDQLRVEMREARQIQPARSVEPPQALAERDRVNPDTLPNAAKGAEIVSAPAAREQREGASTGAAKDAKGQPAQETGRQADPQRARDAAKDAAKDAPNGATKDAKDAKDAARDDRPARKGAARDAKDAADPSQNDAADRGKQGKDASKRQKDAADQKDAKERGKEAKDAARDAKQDAADKARPKDSPAGKDAARDSRRDTRQDRERDQRKGAAKEDGDAGQKKDASEARERQKGQRESRSEREPKALRDDAARGQGRDAADRGRGGDQKRATGRDDTPDRPTAGTSGGREPAAAPRQERGKDEGARGGGSRSEAPPAATTGRAPAAAAPRGGGPAGRPGGGPAGGPGGGPGGPKGGDARD